MDVPPLSHADLDYPACGWVPVYVTNGAPPTARDLVGFTTAILPFGCRQLAFSRPGEPGTGMFFLDMENMAKVIPSPDGLYLAWHVVDHHPSELEVFWAL